MKPSKAHGKIKTLLDQLEISPDYDHKWVAQFQELQKLVEAHVAAEENEMFRKTEAIMTPQEAESLVLALQVRSKRLAVTHRRRKEGLQSPFKPQPLVH